MHRFHPLRVFALLALSTLGTATAQAAPPQSQPAARDGALRLIQSVLAHLGDPTQGMSAEVAIQKPDADEGTQAGQTWLQRNMPCVSRVEPGPLGLLPWGRSTYRPAAAGEPAKLYLIVLTPWHASGGVIAYGLAGEQVVRAYLLAEPKRQLKFEATPRGVTVAATPKNAPAPDPLATVIVLELSGPPKVRSMTVEPSPDGVLVLHGRDAYVDGVNLRFEPEPHKNTLGYWTNPNDAPTWSFRVEKAGTFAVEALQGCGKDSGGSEVEFEFSADQRLPMVVQDTGHFQNFAPRAIGTVKLDAGVHRLTVRVKEKKGVAVMDLRQVTLKPVKAD